MPPTSTHPLFKGQGQPPQQQPSNLNYSSSEPPKAGYYGNAGQPKNVVPGANPWEREEREKELEIRREHARHWRDQQVMELSMLPYRTAQQEEQLKTLSLERDFERRALEEEQEEENDAQYNKGNVQEVLRLAQPGNGNQIQQLTTPTTKLKQVDIKTTPTNISPSGSDENLQQSSPNDQSNNSQAPPPVQPKSILKHNPAKAYNSNPSSPSKHAKSTSFANTIDTKKTNLTEITMNNTNANQMMSQMTKELETLNISTDYNQPISIKTQESDFDGGNMINMPPPPPERNSSYVIMQQQKVRTSGNFPVSKISFNDQINNNNTNYNPKYNSNSPMLSPVGSNSVNNNQQQQISNLAFQQQQQMQQNQQQMNAINNNLTNNSYARDKRVSFHDHENNNVVQEHADMSIVREDPNVSFPFFI